MSLSIALLHPAARIALSEFTVHPSTVIGVVGLGVLYHWRAGSRERGTAIDVGTGSGRARGEVSPHTPPLPVPVSIAAPGSPLPSISQRLNFHGALLLIFLSLNGWLHDLSDYYLFSAHMVQHLVLTLVVPPMLIMGTPGWMLRPLLRHRAVASVARFVTEARIAFVIFNVVLIAWHLPPMYELALQHHPVHITQHVMFMAASTLMWWPILSPLPELPRLSYPLQMLYLFLMSIPMSVIAVSIGYADHILYPSYAAAPRLWGLSPMQDQLLGALIMWIPGGLFFFAIISVIFFRWQQAGGEDSQASAQLLHLGG